MVTFANLGFCVALLVTLIFQCQGQPLSVLWQEPSKCIPNAAAPMTMGYLNALIDFLILLLPIRMVWMLQLPVQRRLAVSGIFGLGMM